MDLELTLEKISTVKSELPGLVCPVNFLDSATIHFQVNTNLPDINKRTPLDPYIVGIIQRSIFDYFNEAYQRHHRGKTLSFNEGQKVETTPSDLFDNYSFSYHRQDKSAPSLEIEVSVKRISNPKIPDYGVKVELKDIPRWGRRHYKALLKIKRIKTYLSNKLNTWKDLKELVPSEAYVEPVVLR